MIAYPAPNTVAPELPSVDLVPFGREHCDLVAHWLSHKRVRPWLDLGGGRQELSRRELYLLLSSPRVHARLFGSPEEAPQGLICLNNVDDGMGAAEIWVVRDLTAAPSVPGLTFAGCLRVLATAFLDLGRHVVCSWVAENNLLSIKLHDRVGMRRTGCQRQRHIINGQRYDRYLYDMTRDEFAARYPDTRSEAGRCYRELASSAPTLEPAQLRVGARAEPYVGIAAAAYNLPGPALDLVEWAAAQSVDPALVERLLSNGCRHFYDAGARSDAELISGAIAQLQLPPGKSLSDVRYLIHAHTQPFSAPPAPRSLLSDLMLTHAMTPELCLSVGQIACASVITAIDLARRLLLQDDSADLALIVTADRVFGKARHRLRQDAGIQSDGASAILLSKGSARCWLGPASFKNFAELHAGPSSPDNCEKIARYTWLHTKQALEEHSRRNGLALADCAQILPINADRQYWGYIARALDLSADVFFLDNIRERGHACSADLAVNLVDRGFSVLERGGHVIACGQSNVGAQALLTLLPLRASANISAKASEEVAACA